MIMHTIWLWYHSYTGHDVICSDKKSYVVYDVICSGCDVTNTGVICHRHSGYDVRNSGCVIYTEGVIPYIVI